MTTVKGLDKLKAQLQRLPERVAAEAAQALAQGAQDLAQAIARAAPRRTGALAASIDWSFSTAEAVDPSNKRQQAIAARTNLLGGKGLSVTVHAGNDKVYWAKWVEFGTSGAPAGKHVQQFGKFKGKTRTSKVEHHPTPAQPFFYPTIRARIGMEKRLMTKATSAAAKAVASEHVASGISI